MTGDPYTSVMMAGVVFSGAIFGDHCSPISDTTVLASIFSGADHMDHVSTQVPYALTGAFAAAVLYMLFGFFNIQPLLLIPLGIIILFILLFVLNNISKQYYKINLREE
jgi:Na+/H+ antiporter NhaC